MAENQWNDPEFEVQGKSEAENTPILPNGDDRYVPETVASKLPTGLVGSAVIKVVGVGGGGCNAITRMYNDSIPGVDYISINTDRQALDKTQVPLRIRVGDATARGLGVGGDPTVGRACHEEDRDKIKESLQGADLVFVAAGMGGGTGTGGAPVVAEVAKEIGALTIGVVTKPFDFEGGHRMRSALDGITTLKEYVDTLIVIPNERLIETTTEKVTMQTAFKMADNVLLQGVQAIAELILVTGEINLDFADVRAVMQNAGHAWMAIGTSSGPDRTIKAAEQAVHSPLLEVDINGARGVIYNVTGGDDLTLNEVTEASEIIKEMAHEDAQIIFGTVESPSMNGQVRLTIIATGFAPAPETIETLSEGEITNVIDDPALAEVPPFMRNHPGARRRFRAAKLSRPNSSSNSGVGQPQP